MLKKVDNPIGKPDNNLSQNIRHCNNFEDFVDLMSEAKSSCNAIFFNGKNADKRKCLTVDFDDIFDNNVTVKYHYYYDILYIGIGDFSL